MNDVFESLDNLIANCQRKIELAREMKKALRLAEFFGVPPKQLGPVLVRFREEPPASPFNPRPWTRVTFCARREDGEWHEAPLVDVHQDLWPEDMRSAFNKKKKEN